MQLNGLNKNELERIRKVKPIFVRAQDLTGVPWQAVAAVWYRESFSVAPPNTPGGSFQFDPVPANSTLEDLLKRYTKLSASERARHVRAGVYNFQAGAIFCACWLRQKTKHMLLLDKSDTAIKDALFGYNGRAYGTADSSPYVMSQADQAHAQMVLRGTIPDKTAPGGRRWIEVIDKRPGAFVVYRQLIDARL